MTVRHVHLGLGNFFRAHQAWYTQHAGDGWDIAAFTGRSSRTADLLAAQDHAYTLLVRDADADRTERIDAVTEARPGTDRDALVRRLADPQVAVVTLTVTEAGWAARDGDSTAARLVAGLDRRRREGAGPLAVVPCDNLPDNGAVARAAVAALAPPDLAGWIEENVSFVSTVVDRITPRTTPDDVAEVQRLTGRHDAVPVVTEPFTEWVLAGAFPAGRPAWDRAGATVVDDVTPFEHRKLRLLNGAHSLLAYGGLLRGHRTVAEAVADPVLEDWMEQWWDEAAATVDLPAADLRAYRTALALRFANPRIRHELAQIATDGSQKLPVRVVPVVRTVRAGGGDAGAGVRVLAAWIAHLRAGTDVHDVAAEQVVPAARAGVPAVLRLLDPELAGDDALRAAIEDALRDLG